jgi:hypothetical protein
MDGPEGCSVQVSPRYGLFDEQAALLSKDVDMCTAKLRHDVMVRERPILLPCHHPTLSHPACPTPPPPLPAPLFQHRVHFVYRMGESVWEEWSRNCKVGSAHLSVAFVGWSVGVGWPANSVRPPPTLLSDDAPVPCDPLPSFQLHSTHHVGYHCRTHLDEPRSRSMTTTPLCSPACDQTTHRWLPGCSVRSTNSQS